MGKDRPIGWNDQISRNKGLLSPRSLKLRQNASKLTNFGRNQEFGAHCMLPLSNNGRTIYVKQTIVHQNVINLKNVCQIPRA